jgi:hypothetical protein
VLDQDPSIMVTRSVSGSIELKGNVNDSNETMRMSHVAMLETGVRSHEHIHCRLSPL